MNTFGLNMCTSKICGLLAACHLVVLWPSTAHAQLTAPREAAQIAFGPLSLYPSVRVVEAGKDTNIFNDGTEPKEDYTFTVRSRALAVLRLGLNELMFSTGSDYVWFREYIAERSNAAQYAVRFNLSATHLKPFVGAEHNRTRSRPSPEIDARARRVQQTALGGLNYSVTDRTSITASIRFNKMSYDDGEQFRGVDLAEVLNRTGKAFSGGARYAVTPLTTLVVTGDYAEDIFTESHARDSRTYSVSPGLEFSPDAAIRGRVMAGFQIFKPRDVTLPEYKGMLVGAALNWSLYGRTTFDLEGTRDVGYSYQNARPYYLMTAVRLQIAQPLFGPLDLQGAAGWEQLSYRSRLEAPINEAASPIATTRTYAGGFGFNFGRGFRVAITAERAQRRSVEDPIHDFRRTRLLSSVTLGY